MKDLSIVFPCYNESGNLLNLFSNLKNILKKNSGLKIEFIIVNNGSIDDTADIIKKNLNI